MPVSPHRRHLPLSLAVGLAAACSSAPSLPRAITIAPGDKVAVHLVQKRKARSDLALTLYNAAALAAVDGNPQVGDKVAADTDLQALLDIFTDKGMFQRTGANPPPGALDVLAVEAGGRRWCWARTEAGVHAATADYLEARSYFLALYNSSEAFHSGSKLSEAPTRSDFEQNRDQAKRDARERIEQLREKPQ